MANIIAIISGGVRAPRGLEVIERLKRDGHQIRLLVTATSWLFLIPHLLRHPRGLGLFLSVWRSAFGELRSYFSLQAAHIHSSKWADLILVAPCTANTLGRIASGLSHTYPLLVVRAIARGRPVLLAPSMNPEMWEDPATQRNYAFLKSTEKYRFVGPVDGVSVSGDSGKVMAPVELIVAEVASILSAGARSVTSPS